MMIPIDNRLPQPPNDAWKDIATTPVPVGEQVVLTDSEKQFVWIGSVSGETTPPPSLAAIGMMATVKTPAFWSSIADQA
jgi:hypothetical protein